MIILFEKKKKTQAFKFLIEKTHRSHMNKNIYIYICMIEQPPPPPPPKQRRMRPQMQNKFDSENKQKHQRYLSKI